MNSSLLIGNGFAVLAAAVENKGEGEGRQPRALRAHAPAGGCPRGRSRAAASQ